MKKIRKVLFGILAVAGLAGCSGKLNGTLDVSKVIDVSGASALWEQISSDMLSQDIFDTLREEWDAWEAKDEFQRMVSSHIPGLCYKGFETLAECEEFLGFSISNPLEDSDWLEKGTYVGMPIGYEDASRFYVNFYGTMDGIVEWIRLESGYRVGEIRITMDTQIEIDAATESVEDIEPLITEDSGEQYVASTAVLVQGAKTYSIRVIGKPGMRSEVQKILDQVLACFERKEQ